MCMQDVQIWRSTQSTTRIVLCPAFQTVTICEADPNRVALWIQNTSSGTVFGSPGDFSSIGGGYAFSQSNIITRPLTLFELGMAITLRWRGAVLGGGDQELIVTEVVLGARIASELPEPSPLVKGVHL